MAQFWGYDSDTRRKFSPGLWGNCPWSGIRNGIVEGIAFEDDFLAGPIKAAGAVSHIGNYNCFADTGGSIADANAQFGAITLASDDDNEGASLAVALASLYITKAAGDMWFEARVKFSTIANTTIGAFIGLIDAATLSATVPIAADGTLADENLVGFWRLEGDGDKLDTYYKADGVTAVAVKADAVTLVADTYVKVGMRFSHETGKLYFYADGVELADNKTIPDATGTDFPSASTDILRPVAAVLNAAGSSPGTMTLDWWAFAQMATP